MLLLFSADRAFCNYILYTNFLAKVKLVKAGKLEFQTNHIISTIYFQEEILDKPVFGPSSKLDVDLSSGKVLGIDTFRKEFAVLRSWYRFKQNIIVHACCWWALMETGK
jgi:hypothetical protein